MTKEKVNLLVSKPYQHTFVDGKWSKWKWTPLHYACGGNNVDLVKLLLHYGAGKTYYKKVQSIKIYKSSYSAKYCSYIRSFGR